MSNKCYLSLHILSPTKKSQHLRYIIAEGQEVQLQEFVSSQFVLPHGHQQCTLVLCAQHHHAIIDAIGTINFSWSQYLQHAGLAAHTHCPKNADCAVIKAMVQDRLLGSVLVALAATPRTVLCQKQRKGADEKSLLCTVCAASTLCWPTH